LPSEASVLVMVVPMLAPMIIGTASSTLNVPDPTRPTMVAVETDDDCTSTVNRMPANSPEMGFATFSSRPGLEAVAEAGDPVLEQRDADEEQVEQPSPPRSSGPRSSAACRCAMSPAGRAR
jgi:hypothetical protein